MATMPPVFRRTPLAEAQRDNDRARGSARARGYDARWDRASAGHRDRNPLCVYCQAGAFAEPRVSASVLTDHLYPHRRFDGVFWLKALWVACCSDCHAAKQAVEHEGRAAIDRLARLIGFPTLDEVRPPDRGGGSKL
jgi:5-methylcytosine-specific restriction protein A